MRRMLNKPVKRQSVNQFNYDEDMYIRAMKRFQKQARGLVPRTKEYDEVRNQVYKELRLEKSEQTRLIDKNKQKFNEVGSIVQADFSSFYCLLVVVPEMTECYETLFILRYFDFPVKVDEDNILRQGIKKEMGFRPDDQVRHTFKICSTQCCSLTLRLARCPMLSSQHSTRS